MCHRGNTGQNHFCPKVTLTLIRSRFSIEFRVGDCKVSIAAQSPSSILGRLPAIAILGTAYTTTLPQCSGPPSWQPFFLTYRGFAT